MITHTQSINITCSANCSCCLVLTARQAQAMLNWIRNSKNKISIYYKDIIKDYNKNTLYTKHIFENILCVYNNINKVKIIHILYFFERIRKIIGLDDV